MEYKIEKVDERNYPLFEDMVFWRNTGFERKPSFSPIPQAVKQDEDCGYKEDGQAYFMEKY